MDLHALCRRATLGLAGACLSALLMAWVARADEVSARGAANAIVVHGPEETLRDFCRERDGILWLELPSGARFELVTRIDDPVIANPGDGEFHPFAVTEVRAALDAVRFPLDGVTADVFLLPYPRRHGLESAAGPGLILLAPGTWPLAPERQHAEVTHELGHVVHHRFLPDHDVGAWGRYRALRGIEDAATYGPHAPHADRPHEIFAEDFRALFGGALANYSGTIENARLAPPASVAGLETFMLSLAGSDVRLSVLPNPSAGPLQFVASGGEPMPLDLFDLAGRRIATLTPRSANGAWLWTWDGRDAEGAIVRASMLIGRVRGRDGAVVRLTRLH